MKKRIAVVIISLFVALQVVYLVGCVDNNKDVDTYETYVSMVYDNVNEVGLSNYDVYRQEIYENSSRLGVPEYVFNEHLGFQLPGLWIRTFTISSKHVNPYDTMPSVDSATVTYVPISFKDVHNGKLKYSGNEDVNINENGHIGPKDISQPIIDNTVTIIYKLDDNKSLTRQFRIQREPILETSVEISLLDTTSGINVTEKKILVADVYPKNASFRGVFLKIENIVLPSGETLTTNLEEYALIITNSVIENENGVNINTSCVVQPTAKIPVGSKINFRATTEYIGIKSNLLEITVTKIPVTKMNMVVQGYQLPRPPLGANETLNFIIGFNDSNSTPSVAIIGNYPIIDIIKGEQYVSIGGDPYWESYWVKGYILTTNNTSGSYQTIQLKLSIDDCGELFEEPTIFELVIAPV